MRVASCPSRSFRSVTRTIEGRAECRGVQATHFDGPVQEIFMFIDLNGDGEIDGQEFFTLEQYGASIFTL